MRTIRSGTFVPTIGGDEIEPGPYRVDVGDGFKSYDGRVRLKRGKIAIDLFDSSDLDTNRVRVNGGTFANVKDANDFLEEYGFAVRVKAPPKKRTRFDG